MKRCINCKADILAFGERRLEGFVPSLPPAKWKLDYLECYDPQYGKLTGSLIRFVRRGEEGCFHHLTVERAFSGGKIFLRVDEVYTSYLKHSWNVAMCTGKVLANGWYSRLGTVPQKAEVRSPWFTADNDRESLLAALDQLGDWLEEHREELDGSWTRQQGWLDKQSRAYRVGRVYFDAHREELTQAAVGEVYRRVDKLAEEYNALPREQREGPLSFFNDYCYGKLPAPLDRWVEELSAVMVSRKGRVVKDLDYARGFAVTALLYYLHDSQKDIDPEYLTAKVWKRDGAYAE